MKIKRLVALVLFLSLIALNAWGVNPPQVISSIPANGHLTADPLTECISITFSEPMNESFTVSYSPDYLGDDQNLSHWSADMRTFHYCRSSRFSPLPLGDYRITLNPTGYTARFKAAATQIALPETIIRFTVTANGSNGTVPQVISSFPANGAVNVSPTTAYFEVTFSEPMSTNDWNYTWPDEDSWSGWDNNVIWSADGRTFRVNRGLAEPPLPTGNYCLTLSDFDWDPSAHFISAAGVVLPTTSICFTVGTSGQANLIHTYYIPYFTSGGVDNYWLGLGISNNNGLNSASFQVTIFNSNGTVLSTSPTETIAPNGQFASLLAAGQTATGWIKIDSSEELSGLSFMGFTFMGSSLMADVPFVSELSTALMIPHVAQEAYWDTKVLVCNPNNTPAVITLTFFSPNGQAIVSAPQQLGAFCSSTYALGSLLANHLPLPRGKVKLTVTQGDGICAFALYTNQKTGNHCFAGISADPLVPSGPIHPF